MKLCMRNDEIPIFILFRVLLPKRKRGTTPTPAKLWQVYGQISMNMGQNVFRKKGSYSRLTSKNKIVVTTGKRGEHDTGVTEVCLHCNYMTPVRIILCISDKLRAGLKLKWCVYARHKPPKGGQVMEHLEKFKMAVLCKLGHGQCWQIVILLHSYLSL